MLIDLDPQECPYDMIVEAALMVKEVLDRIGLTGYPKTTGGDGMHVYIPVEPVYSYEETRTFAELIARLVTQQKPQMFTTPRSVGKRQKNRVYFDYLQNGKSKTIAAPYVLRAYAGAPVATPLEWSEVKHGAGPEAVQHRQCARAVPPEGRFVPRGAGGAAESLRRARQAGEAVPVALLLGGQEDDDAVAAEDKVGGRLSGGIALAGDDAAVDDGPAIVFGVAEAELAERGVAHQVGEFLVEGRDVELEIRPGAWGRRWNLRSARASAATFAAGSQASSPIQRPSRRKE